MTVATNSDKITSATERAVRQPSTSTVTDGQHGVVEELGLAAVESAPVQEGEKLSFHDEIQYRTMGWFQAGAGTFNIRCVCACFTSG